jgi:diacylglycerol kinase family enzyme
VRVTLVHNPTAGDESHSAAVLIAAIESRGHEVAYASVKDEGWERALDASADLVAAAGGDGTVRKVFAQVAHRDVLVTLLPLGTANNIATALGFGMDDPETLIAGWESGARRHYDVGRVEAPWGEARFLESVGGGLFAELLRRADAEDRPDGADKVETGLLLLRELLADPPLQRWEIAVDDRDVSGDYAAVEVLNVPQTGPAVPLAPGGDPGDGRFEVALVGSEEAQALRTYVERRIRDESTASPELEVIAAHRVRIVTSRSHRLRVDDELWPEDEDEAAAGTVTAAVGSHITVLVP